MRPPMALAGNRCVSSNASPGCVLRHCSWFQASQCVVTRACRLSQWSWQKRQAAGVRPQSRRVPRYREAGSLARVEPDRRQEIHPLRGSGGKSAICKQTLNRVGELLKTEFDRSFPHERQPGFAHRSGTGRIGKNGHYSLCQRFRRRFAQASPLPAASHTGCCRHTLRRRAGPQPSFRTESAMDW